MSFLAKLFLLLAALTGGYEAWMVAADKQPFPYVTLGRVVNAAGGDLPGALAFAERVPLWGASLALFLVFGLLALALRPRRARSATHASLAEGAGYTQAGPGYGAG